MNATAAPDTSSSKRAAGKADAATLALVNELQALAAELLGRGIERMFDGADDLLFDMARRASNNKDQRIYFDTMRVVRLGRPRIGKIFRDEIAAGFEPGAERAETGRATAADYEDLSLQESRALEESIAVAAMASKAENLYSHPLFELGRRLEWLVKEKHAPISVHALTPATISSAFRRSAQTLDVEFEVELVIFKLFDRLVISELGELYSRALDFLDQHKVKAAAYSSNVPRKPGAPEVAGARDAPAHPPVAAAAAAARYGFAQLPTMDADTLNALRSLGAGYGRSLSGAVPTGIYGDAQLGSELAMAASGQVVPGWEAPRAFAYAQRAGAVGQMFNDYLRDPSLPGPLKPRFDQLRFSVIKSALRDAGFFADRHHPVRALLNELATLAASARTGGLDAIRRIEELVSQIQSQFDIAADEVRRQSAPPATVDDPTLEQFFAQQQDDARQRRQSLIERTRRVVAEELQLQTLGRGIPDALWPLLNSGWAPLAALRLLRHGADSEGWGADLALLRRILDSVDARCPEARAVDLLRLLEDELDARLREIGMLDERVYALMRGWREAVQDADALAAAAAASERASEAPAPERVALGEPAAATAGSPAPDAIALLDLLMVLSSWFRVYDHDRSQNRWLKVVAHSPAEGRVTFAEFNGQNPLQLRTEMFLDDLVASRAEPIDLGPAARRALDTYLAARRDASRAAAEAA